MSRTLGILLIFSSLLGASYATEKEKVLAAYVPAWGIATVAAEDPGSAGITHLIYAFVKPSLNRESGKVELLLDFEGNGVPVDGAVSAFDDFLALVGEESSVKKMVSLGGWGLSEAFSDIAATEPNRREFAEEVARFVESYRLDGVDLDWEYPVEGGVEGTVARPEDAVNLVKLAAILREALDGLEDRTGEQILLTVAIPAPYDALRKRYQLKGLSESVDWFNVMAYDFAGTWSTVTAHVAPLDAPGDPAYTQYSVRGTIAALGELGVPEEKIVLGLGLAGVRFEDVKPGGGQWIGVPFAKMNENTREASWNDFRYLASSVLYPPMNDGEWSLRWDGDAEASYWVCSTAETVISFESIRSAEAKAEVVRADDLRGMMIWSLDKDGNDLPLVRAVAEVLE